MLDRENARRPAQVNACFSGGSSQRDAIVAALHEAGLTDEQITVIDRPDPEATEVEPAEPSLLDRIKELFGGDDEEHEARHYDLYILAHLGQDEALAGPVQDVFTQFNAADVRYYPSARPNMDVLGGTDPTTGSSTIPDPAAWPIASASAQLRPAAHYFLPKRRCPRKKRPTPATRRPTSPRARTIYPAKASGRKSERTRARPTAISQDVLVAFQSSMRRIQPDQPGGFIAR
jgi:hypothetical protein